MYIDTMSEVKWTDDVRQLWAEPFAFFPQDLNSSTRFVLYSGVFLAVLQRSFLPIVGAVVLGILLAMVYGRRKQRETVFLEIERKQQQACPGPTRDNPYANTPVAAFGTDRQPCPKLTAEGMDKANAMLRTYLFSDTEDVFGDEWAMRPFHQLPNGGSHPDFSRLAAELRPTHS